MILLRGKNDLVDERARHKRARAVLHGKKRRLRRSLTRGAQHGLRPRCPAEHDLDRLLQIEGLAKLRVGQKLILACGDHDLVDALGAVDSEQRPRKHRYSAELLQELVFSAVAR